MLDKKEMVKHMCSLFPGGRAALADALHMTITAFNNNLYEKNGCRFFDFDELVKMQTLTKSTCVAEYFAHIAGAVVVSIPEESELDSVELHHLSLNTDVRRGEVDRLIMSSITDDGGIDPHEARQILSKHSKHLAARDKQIRATLLVYQKLS